MVILWLIDMYSMHSEEMNDELWHTQAVSEGWRGQTLVSFLCSLLSPQYSMQDWIILGMDTLAK